MGMRVRPFASVLSLAVLVGCSSMQRVPVDFITEEKPAEVRLANSYGIVTTLHNPRLSGDTIYGNALGKDAPVAIPLRQIEGISTRRFDKGRTTALVVGSVAVMSLSAWAMFGASSGDIEVTCDYSTRSLESNGGAPVCTQRQQ